MGGPTNFESHLWPRSLAESERAQILLIFWRFGSECHWPLVADGPVFKPNPQRGRGFRFHDKVELFRF